MENYFKEWKKNKNIMSIIDKEKWNYYQFDHEQEKFMALGLIFKKKVLNMSKINMCKNIFKKVSEKLNEKLKLRTFNATIETLRERNFSYREIVVRGNPEADSTKYATMDITMCHAAFKCEKLKQMFENLSMIKKLKQLYEKKFGDKKKLLLKNFGYFCSPRGNVGQEWHTDLIFPKYEQENFDPCNLVTVLISLVDQDFDKESKTTSGSTVFAPFSHLGRKPYNNWKIIQPILLEGDMVAFQGNLFHHGGSFLLNQNQFCQDERLAIYGVFHLCIGDKSLVKDANIENLPDSLFGGEKLQVQVHGQTIHIVKGRAQRAQRRNEYLI